MEPSSIKFDYPLTDQIEVSSRVAEILARFEGANRSYILNCVFGDLDEAENDLDPEERDELLHCLLGSAEDWAEDWAGMSEHDKEAHYSHPAVRNLVVAYADSVANALHPDLIGCAALGQAVIKIRKGSADA